MKRKGSFPAPSYIHPFSAVALSWENHRNYQEPALVSTCCTKVVSAHHFHHPGTELSPHSKGAGALSEPLSEHPVIGLYNSPGLTLHLGLRFSTLQE